MSNVICILLFLGGLCHSVAVLHETRYYNKINFHNYTSLDTFQHSLLSSDRSGQFVTTSNLILGVSTPECDHLLENPAFRAAQRYGGGGVLVSASLPAKEFPLSIESCAQIFFYRISTPLSRPAANTTNFSHKDVTVLINQNLHVNFKFVNNFSETIDFYWYSESKDPLLQGSLHPGESIVTGTYIGHIFGAHKRTPETAGELPGPTVDFFVVRDDSYTFSPENRLQTCESYDDEYIFVPDYLSCENMESRFLQFRMYVWYDKRLGSNYVQPKFVPPVTKEGFMLKKLPESTYSWLKLWYDRQKLIDANAERSKSVCMNQVVAPTEMTHLPPDLKDQLSAEMKPLLQDWYGTDKEPLVLTSIYGVRKYTNGSILRMHVDTVNTHVVSAIINVDQKVDKDWPLLILDHDGNEHNIIMKPGDYVLYESARLLHGRPDVFVGEHYDNIFIHYMPESGWDYSWV